jgi:hypothetical protein
MADSAIGKEHGFAKLSEESFEKIKRFLFERRNRETTLDDAG